LSCTPDGRFSRSSKYNIGVFFQPRLRFITFVRPILVPFLRPENSRNFDFSGFEKDKEVESLFQNGIRFFQCHILIVITLYPHRIFARSVVCRQLTNFLQTFGTGSVIEKGYHNIEILLLGEMPWMFQGGEI
jgi:hypothetical protein